jgi:molybdopterin-dependent oxidoreductase alpha subunit
MERKEASEPAAEREEVRPPSENSGAQPPEKLGGIKIRALKTRSAGIPGIAAAFSHARRYMKPKDAIKALRALNQKGGFDCPGCAWPDPDDERSRLGEFCENGVKALAEEAQHKLITRDFFNRHAVNELLQWSDFDLGKQGRLAEPFLLREGGSHYEPVSWHEAFEIVAKALNDLDTPDEAIFYTSGRTSNEAAFLYQLFVREYGANNLPDCSNLCHESSGKALDETIGVGKGTVTLRDFHEAELIIIMGQNPGTNHPRMLSALERCKENGGKIIAVNPLPEAGLLNFINPQRPGKILTGGTTLSDLFLPVRVNGDVALLKAIMLLLWHEERKAPGTVFHWDFITEHTEGYEAFIQALRKENFNELVEACGVSRELIKQAVELIRKRDKIIVCWAMGLTQHENAMDNVRQIVNLLLLKGAIGRPGAGPCPVRGHSNVQGDRTMGICEAPKPEFLDRLEAVFGFSPPRAPGYATVDAIQAMYEGRAKVFFALGGNFLSAAPDTEYTAEALRRCALTVQVSTKLNRGHLITGRQAIILPCLGRSERDVQDGGEQFVSTENSMGVVQLSKGVLPPCSDRLRSEPAIVAGLARATLGDRSKVNWEAMVGNYNHIRDAIAQVVPGCEDYNRRVRQTAGFYLPNPARERQFPTPSGKARFSTTGTPRWELSEGQYLMMTIRSHDQFNTTIYGLDDRYRGVYRERRVVFVNAEDLRSAGLSKGQQVHLRSQYDGMTRLARYFVVVPYDIPSGCVATYYPEANVLVPISRYAEGSKTPISKSVIVEIIPVEKQI